MTDRPKPQNRGAYEFDALVDENQESPADEFANPPGISRGDCDVEAEAQNDATCDVEITAQVQDLFLEETKPGFGIPGFEGEEDGGG